jgi:hypothetical protein
MHMRGECTIRSHLVERVAQALDEIVNVLMSVDTANIDMQYLHEEKSRKYNHAF